MLDFKSAANKLCSRETVSRAVYLGVFTGGFDFLLHDKDYFFYFGIGTAVTSMVVDGVFAALRSHNNANTKSRGSSPAPK